MTKTAEQVVAEALVGTILTGSRVLSPEQREDVVAITVTALREAGMLDETEWEYQWGEPEEETDFTGFDNFGTYEEAKADMENHSEYESHRVMRRRRAGEWEEVPNE